MLPDKFRSIIDLVDKVLIPKPVRVPLADGDVLEVLLTPHFLALPIIQRPSIIPAPKVEDPKSKT